MQKLKTKIKNIQYIKITPLFVLFFFFASIQKVHAAKAWGDFLAGAVDATVGNLAQGIGFILEYIGRFVIFLGSQFLDLAISFSLNTANLKMPAITETWTIARDVTNMLFIFILLYVGIMLILRIGSFQTKKILTNLIIIGLLLNFSYFLTGAVIDAGNISAGVLYNAMTPTVTLSNGDIVEKKIGGILINNMNLTLLNQSALNANPSAGELDSFKMAISHLSNAVFFVVAGFAFFAGAFIFIIRQVVLTFVIILSPLAFAALILPNTLKHWRTWLSALIGSTFIAPVYLLMVSFVVMISGSSGFAAATQDSVNQYETTAGVSQFGGELLSASDIILQYTLIVGMMIASVIVSKNVSSSIGKMSINMSNKLMGTGARGALGGAGFAYRNVVGRGAQFIANREGFQEKASSNFGARQAMRLTKYAAGASGDVRDAPGMKTITKATKKKTGVDLGKGAGKGGFIKQEEETIKKQVKKETDIGASLGQDKKLVAAKEATLKEAERNERKGRAKNVDGAEMQRLKQEVANSKEQLERVKTKRQVEYAENVAGRGTLRSAFTFRTSSRNKVVGDKVREEAMTSKSKKENKKLKDLILGLEDDKNGKDDKKDTSDDTKEEKSEDTKT